MANVCAYCRGSRAFRGVRQGSKRSSGSVRGASPTDSRFIKDVAKNCMTTSCHHALSPALLWSTPLHSFMMPHSGSSQHFGRERMREHDCPHPQHQMVASTCGSPKDPRKVGALSLSFGLCSTCECLKTLNLSKAVAGSVVHVCCGEAYSPRFVCICISTYMQHACDDICAFSLQVLMCVCTCLHWDTCAGVQA